MQQKQNFIKSNFIHNSKQQSHWGFRVPSYEKVPEKVLALYIRVYNGGFFLVIFIWKYFCY